MKKSEALEIRRGREPSRRRARESSGIGVWSIVGGAALVLLAAGLIVNLPDIKRYYKMSTM